MDYALGVCRPERIGNLNRQFQHFVERKRLARNAVLHRFTVEKLHSNELLAVLLADVVNGADVRVIQRRSGLRFAAETLQSTGIVEHFGRQEFQTHRTMEPRVLSFIDNTHPSTPELFEDAIVRDGLADERVGS